ncbi:MAG: hypothetical protein HYZ81_23475 [Nitrospinae bacterium]|nr:hypothetical protein [Nitrospinota bacterium]
MTPEAILDTLKMSGARVEVVGDKLRCRAPEGTFTPELRQAMAQHKAALLRLLTTPDARRETPCPACGASDWRATPDGGRWCLPCVLAGRTPVCAYKIHSHVLAMDLWIVADDLPREARPRDAPVYTHAEVMILVQAGPDTLEWVHAVKTMFNGKVVQGHRKGEPHG